MKLVPQRFYVRDALFVARELLGMHIVHGAVTLRITEVEAYRHLEPVADSANHCRVGWTPRNAPMWGPGGHAYIYICYGIHAMLNLVTGADGEGAAVLIRSAAVVAGAEIVAQRRGRAESWVAGPGKVAQALGLDTGFSGAPLFRAGGLEVRRGTAPRAVLVGPRVGIESAAYEHRVAPWRFADADARVSVPKTLGPESDAD